MPNATPEATAVLVASADQLSKQSHLWKNTGDLRTDESCTCVALSIQDNVWETPAVPHWSSDLERSPISHLNERSAAEEEAFERVLFSIPEPELPKPLGEALEEPFDTIAKWNDRPETTLEDAVSLLRRAAASA